MAQPTPHGGERHGGVSLKVSLQVDPGIEQGLPGLEVAQVALLEVQLLGRLIFVREADTVGNDLFSSLFSSLAPAVLPDSLDLDHAGCWGHSLL